MSLKLLKKAMRKNEKPTPSGKVIVVALPRPRPTYRIVIEQTNESN